MIASPTATASSATPLVDIQSTPDQRNIAIDKVGVKRVKYPIKAVSYTHLTLPTIYSV